MVKKIKDPTITQKGKIVVALRMLWLRSRERATALKRDNYTCRKCNHKQSMAKGKEFKVQVHHINGIEWEEMIEFIRKRLLIHPDGLITVCKDCHSKEHEVKNEQHKTKTKGTSKESKV